MTNVHSSNNQESLSSMLLSPEAKEFIPRHFSDGTSTSDPGTGLLGAGSSGLVTEENCITQQEPVNGLPSYMTTCYPFVPGGEARISGRGRLRGKYPQQAMFMQHFHAMQPGITRNRFPNSPNGYPATTAWGNMSEMFQQFGNMSNGMPFDGGTYQNGFIQQKSHTQGPGGKKNSALSSKTCCKHTTVQTDFPETIANATLEDVPNTLYSNEGQVAYKDHHKPSSSHKQPSATSSTMNDGSYEKDVGSVAIGYNTVSNGTNPAIDFNNEVVDLVTDHVTRCMRSPSALSSSALTYKSGLKVKGESLVSMHDSVTKVPSLTENTPVNPPTLTYASIAQGKSQTSQNKKHSQVNTVTAESCDNNVSLKKNENTKMLKGSRTGGRLENVNVAEIMEDLERADKNKTNVNKKKSEPLQKVLSAYYDQIEVKQVGKPLNNARLENKQEKVSGTNNSVNTTSQSLYSKVVENTKQASFSSRGIQSSQVKGQGLQTQSDSYKSDLDLEKNLEKKGQSQSDNNNNQGESGEVKKKRRRRRRRKKKSGDTNEEEDENLGAEDVTLHFEDDEEFPDLSGVCNGDTKSSPTGLSSVSYSDILRNNNTVQSRKSSQDEQCPTYITGASPVKESRTSRKRRKRREVANKAADAEMAEIGLEQHMLELKMKQKLPLAAKKSVSPVRNTTTQGVWKLTPSSTTSTPSSTGKKVSLLLPGTVAPEPAHNSTPHQPNTAAVKQPGILKTSQPVNTSSGTSGGGGGAGGGGKKSKQPITYDLSALIDAAETKKEQPSTKKDAKAVVIKRDDLKPHNILDSSAPTLKRGKERENPKTKKPSPLKKVILKEREEKKRLRMLDEDEVASGFGMMPASAFPNSPISAPVGIGVVSGGESDLSQDASFKGSIDVGIGTPVSAELSPISQPSPSCMSPISPGASPMSSGVNSPSTGTIQQTVKLKIHSRRFREYCNQVLDKEIDNHVTLLLQDLVRFQDKQFHKDPVKAKSKRRFVLGLREVTKHLKLRKVKCVVISPNLEKIQSKGGLDDALNTILELCNDQKVPFIFALGRRALGRACAKLVPVSVVGVFNYEGSEENFRSLVNLTEKARDAYREMIAQIEKEIAEHPPRASVPGVPHIFAHMGHSRTPSGCSVISFTSSILSEPISENYPHSEPETDNRGYEIEKDDDEDGENDDGKDPYEADDEGGYNTRRNVTHLYSESYSNSSKEAEADISGNNKDVHDVDGKGDNVVHKMPSGSSKNTDINDGKTKNINCDDESDIDDYEDDNDDDITSDEDDGLNKDSDSSNHEISEADQRQEGEDTVEELPTFIDSVHNFDPFSEILSQHSSKTMENGEDVMSTHSSKTTHSSRTLGDGSSLTVDKVGKIMDTKSAEKVNSLALKTKPEVDKDLKEFRTRSWVKEAQTLHFSDQVDRPKDNEETGASDFSHIAKECRDLIS